MAKFVCAAAASISEIFNSVQFCCHRWMSNGTAICLDQRNQSRQKHNACDFPQFHGGYENHWERAKSLPACMQNIQSATCVNVGMRPPVQNKTNAKNIFGFFVLTGVLGQS
jgi:hypothetical protein